ncbi:MAG: hypothetical protein KJ630_07005 [Proteobacteria bacterium]|nr:hypothetical protein [Pseudomonadota bacterium]
MKDELKQFNEVLGDKVSSWNADVNMVLLRGDGQFTRGGKNIISPYDVLHEMEDAKRLLNEAYQLIYRTIFKLEKES